MTFPFQRIRYRDLNSRQKESYNFQKLSGVLADFGYCTIRLSDDWNGADLIAQHISGSTLLIQLKSRFSLYAKYQGKELFIAFPAGGDWYLYPHDEVLQEALQRTNIGGTDSWSVHGGYSCGSIPESMKEVLSAYRLPSTAAAS